MAEKNITLNEGGQKAVLLQLAKMQGNTSLADFTISCKGQEWKVHRLVLSLHSPVLMKACEGSFKVRRQRSRGIEGVFSLT